MERNGGYRVTIVNSNVPNMVGQISSAMADEGLNIIDMINKSQGELAYSLIDINAPASDTLLGKLAAIDGVLAARAL